MLWDRWLWRPRKRELQREVEEELTFHLEMRARDLAARGRDPDEAEKEARRRFGDVRTTRREMLALRNAQVQQEDRSRLWSELRQDVRFGLRQQLRKPALPLFIVVLLTLGVGATTAVFSVVRAVLLSPLPYPSPQRLVFLSETREGYSRLPASYPNYEDWRESSESFQDVGGFTPWYFSVAGPEGSDRVLGTLVSAGVLELLGVEPELGRTFTAEEDRQGAPKVVVLSHGFWSRRYGADPEIVGREIRLDGEPTTVVGVMPSGFQVPRTWLVGEKADLWVPLWTPAMVQTMATARGTHWMGSLARLRDGISLETARQEMGVIAETLAQQYPDSNEGGGVRLTPVQEELVSGARGQLLMLLSGAGLLLLVVCANVAGLLLARATSRQSEVAIRAALGAGQWRILRQLLAECLPLALLAGGLGFVVARSLIGIAQSVMPSDIPGIDRVELDGPVLLCSIGLSVLSALLFSLAPAWLSTRTSLNEVLQSARGNRSPAGDRNRLRNALVAAQLAVALILGNSAALMLQSYTGLAKQEYGFDTESVLTARVTVQGPEYGSQDDVQRFHQEVLRGVLALPGVRSAGVTSKLPLEGGSNTTLVEAEGHDFSETKGPATEVSIVSPGYFQAIGISLLAGRSLEPADSEMTSIRPAVINRTMADSLWPDDNPLGKTFSLSEDRTWTVVGVAADVPQFGPERKAIGEVYLSFDPDPSSPFFAFDTVRYLVVRTDQDPLALGAAVTEQVARVDRDQPVSELRTTGGMLASALKRRRFNTLLAGFFALSTLLLAAAGIYGVIAFFVAQRTREIGVRVALGATWPEIRGLVIRHAARLAAMGVGAGLVGVVATTGLTRSMIYGLSPLDPLTVAGSAFLLLAVACLGALVPARRAARVDPVLALKAE